MLKTLIIAPVPPPFDGGIATWTHCVRKGFRNSTDVELCFVDTTVRYRPPSNLSLLLRLTGGSYQAIRDTFRTFRRIRKERPDVVHLCTSGGLATAKDILILQIAKWCGIPTIIHYHMGRLPNIIERNGLDWRLTRRAMQSASVVLLLDVRTKACVEAALPDLHPVLLSNLVEIEAVEAIAKQPSPFSHPADRLNIVFAGHMLPTKGVRELVVACTQLANTPLTLNLIGPVGPDVKSELEQIAAAREGGNWMHIHGKKSRDDAVRCIAHADIFTLPSYSEGMPNVILEAMACGQTILATTVGAIPEMLDIAGPNPCGICVPPRSADALAAAITELAAKPELRKEFGRRARERVAAEYSTTGGCEKLLDLWRKTSENKRA